jgi:UPF0271 protein
MDELKNKSNQKSSNISYVLDASAVYNGILAHNLKGLKYLPECVITEIQGMIRGEAIIEEALLYEDLKIASVEPDSLAKIKEVAQKTGDIQELSNCDLAVLSIAYTLIEQKIAVTIISDDYDIQNLAAYLNIPSRGIYWKGITSIHKYQWVCPACKAISVEKRTHCIECGTELKKRTIRKKISKKK